MSDLPVNIDTTYDDDGADASVKVHQQHHDALHALYNDVSGASPDLGNLGIAADDHDHTGTYDPAGTAASAVTAHEADTTSVHGIADTSVLATDTDVADAVAVHTGDASDAHDASAISILDTGAKYTATNVEDALAEVKDVADAAAGGGTTLEQVQDDLGNTSLIAGTSLSKSYNDGDGTITLDVDAADFATAAQGGTADTAVQPGDTIPVADGGTGGTTPGAARTNLGLVIGTDVQAYSAVLAGTTASFLTADETKLDGIAAGATDDTTVNAHIADTTDAHDASAISVADSGALLDATDVEAALAEIATDVAAIPDLAAADPTELGISTSLGVTTLTIASTIARQSAITTVNASLLTLAGTVNTKMSFQGTAAAPLTDAGTARVAAAGIPTYWLMANGVTPTNAIDGDIIWNADA